MQVIELLTEEQWSSAHNCLAQLRSKLELESMLSRRESLIERGFHLLGIADDDQKMVCVGSYVIHPHIEQVSDLWVHDLVTLDSHRSGGYGAAMMKYVEKVAAETECSRVLVYTGLDKDRAQNFYSERAGLAKYSLVYRKFVDG